MGCELLEPLLPARKHHLVSKAVLGGAWRGPALPPPPQGNRGYLRPTGAPSPRGGLETNPLQGPARLGRKGGLGSAQAQSAGCTG